MYGTRAFNLICTRISLRKVAPPERTHLGDLRAPQGVLFDGGEIRDGP